MAAIDLGQVKGDKGVSVRNRGTWNSTAQYINNTEYIDIVFHNGSLWICATTNTNSAPSKTNTKWNIAAEGVASIANNLTTTAAGSALDARQGPVIKSKIDKIYADKLLTMDEIDLVTEEGFFVDALAVKELNSNLTMTSYTAAQCGISSVWEVLAWDCHKIGNTVYINAEIYTSAIIVANNVYTLSAAIPVDLRPANSVFPQTTAFKSTFGDAVACTCVINTDGRLRLTLPNADRPYVAITAVYRV